MSLLSTFIDSHTLTVAGVCSLIAILSYGAQYVLCFTAPPLTPGSPSTTELWTFNLAVLCIWLSYFRCLTTPAAYLPSERALPRSARLLAPGPLETEANAIHSSVPQNPRFCKKCALPKPPRAHHCRTCNACIPKMDHHCRWIGRCVGYRNLPPFIRFLGFCTAALAQNGLFLLRAWLVIWELRGASAYLGPSTGQLLALTGLTAGNALVLFALGILLVRTVWGWALNITAIEDWEVERHRALVRRSMAGQRRGWLSVPGGGEIRYEKVEFPYDVGIWRNFCLGMGTANVLGWVWPLAGGLELRTEEQRERVAERDVDISGEVDDWPPPDPEKMGTWRGGGPPIREGKVAGTVTSEKQGEWEGGVRRRQKEDRDRRRKTQEHEEVRTETPTSTDPEPVWTNWEGERLEDYGVDEDTERYGQDSNGNDGDENDEDDTPLAELFRRRTAVPTPPSPRVSDPE